MKTLAQMLAWGQASLSHLENSKREAGLLLAHVLGKSYTTVQSHPEYILSFGEWIRFIRVIKKRAQHVPFAYITGYKNWHGYTLFVNKEVLIPRDETEILCQHIAQHPRENPPQHILDIGTGSGCLSLWCAKTFPTARITATDISRSALTLAKRNFKKHSVLNRIDIHKGFLLNTKSVQKKWDIVIANLPYIPTTMTLAPEVMKEPQKALFSGEDGLTLIRQLFHDIQEKNIHFSELWLEFLPQQQAAIENLLPSDWKKSWYPDLSGQIFFVCLEPRSS